MAKKISSKNEKQTGLKYLQIQVPHAVADEFEQITQRLGLSKQRSLTLALYIYNGLGDDERLKAYSATLNMFAAGGQDDSK